MKNYEVIFYREVRHSVTVIVEAESEDDAIEKVKNGEYPFQEEQEDYVDTISEDEYSAVET